MAPQQFHRPQPRVGVLDPREGLDPRIWRAIESIVMRALDWLNELFVPRSLLFVLWRHARAVVLLYGAYFAFTTLERWLKRSARAIRERLSLALGHGYYRRLRELRDAQHNANSFDEFKRVADEEEALTGASRWKDDPSSPYYDYERIARNVSDIRSLLDDNDVLGIMRYMRSRLLRNLAGIGHKLLYTQLRAGTKALIEEYIDVVARALHLVSIETSGLVTNLDKLNFFNETRHSFGRSALMLSGGATLGMYHVGVIKCLHESQLLPRVISGASAGAVIAAMLGVMTDSELDRVTEPGRVDLAFFPSQKGSLWRKLRRLISQGVIFDIEILRDCLRANLGDLTFREAYARTGRVVNIVVAPAGGSREVPRLLNYLTSPDVVVWSAACASSAIPYVYEAVELMAKDPETGAIVPYYTEGIKWSDGSFRSDLPMRRLSELFNVNHYIVSQVNPHVAPLAIRARSDLFGLVPSILTYLGDELRHVIVLLYHLLGEYIPPLRAATLIPTIMLQKYYGDITILPPVQLRDYLEMFENPTNAQLVRCTRRNERNTWRHMAEVKGHCAIEAALDQCVRRMRGAMLLKRELSLDGDAPGGGGRAMLGNRLMSWSPDEFGQYRAQIPIEPVDERGRRSTGDAQLRSAVSNEALDKNKQTRNHRRKPTGTGSEFAQAREAQVAKSFDDQAAAPVGPSSPQIERRRSSLGDAQSLHAAHALLRSMSTEQLSSAADTMLTPAGMQPHHLGLPSQRTLSELCQDEDVLP